MRMTPLRTLPLVLLAAAALTISGCSADPAPTAPEPGGEFDLEALTEAAQAEGDLTIYADASEASLRLWADAFTAEYDIQVTVVRDATAPLYQKFSQEEAAGQHQADVISILDHAALDQAVENEWIAEYTPQEAEGLPAEYARAGYYFAVQSVTSPVIAYNTDNVTAAEAKKLATDPVGFLTTPGMTDRIGVVAPHSGRQNQSLWYLYTEGRASDEYGWEAAEAIAANTNRISDAVSTAQGVVQGEFDFGFGLPDSYMISLITGSGAPLGFVYPTPTVVVTSALAVSAGAQHPNAARLFSEWAASAAGVEAWSTGSNNAPIRSDVDDPRTYLDEDWFVARTDNVWVDFESDDVFLEAMAADGEFFATWNETFGYSG